MKLSLREISDAEQTEAKVLAALDDWDKADANYHEAVKGGLRSNFLGGFVLGFVIGLLVWLLTQSVR